LPAGIIGKRCAKKLESFVRSVKGLTTIGIMAKMNGVVEAVILLLPSKVELS